MSDEQNSVTVVDRRIQRTTLAIQRSMMELVREQGYDAVDVQAITDRANIGRSTFYTHFRNKEDVLLRSLDGLHQSMRCAWANGLTEPDRGLGKSKFVFPFIVHFGGNVELWRSFATGDGAEIVTRKLRGIFTDLFRTDLNVDLNSPPEAEARVQIRVGALVALVVWWLDLGATISPEAVYRVYVESFGH